MSQQPRVFSSVQHCEVSYPHYTNSVESTNVGPFGLLSWLQHDDMLCDLLDLYPGIYDDAMFSDLLGRYPGIQDDAMISDLLDHSDCLYMLVSIVYIKC